MSLVLGLFEGYLPVPRLFSGSPGFLLPIKNLLGLFSSKPKLVIVSDTDYVDLLARSKTVQLPDAPHFAHPALPATRLPDSIGLHLETVIPEIADQKFPNTPCVCLFNINHTEADRMSIRFPNLMKKIGWSDIVIIPFSTDVEALTFQSNVPHLLCDSLVCYQSSVVSESNL